MSGRADLRRRALLAAALLSAAAGCSGWRDDDPAPRAVRPASGVAGVPIAIRIEGDGLRPGVHADYGDASRSYVESGYTARLGGVRLRDVRPTADGALEAIVPETLGAGTHELAVVSPSGREGVLPSAYRAVAPSAPAGVAALRISAVGPQQAMRPFAITITALDAEGNVATEFSGTVDVTSAAGSVFPATVGPFAWGVWTGEVELRDAAPAAVLAAADGTGASGASAPFAVAPVPAARLAFASPALDAVAGACSPVDVAVEDAFGASTPATSPLAVALSAAPAGPGFFADAACTGPAAAVTIPAGASAASVHARSTVAGSFTLAASAGPLVPAQQPASFRAAATDRLAFTTAPQVVAAGACSGAATVEAQDAFGNATPVAAAADVALSAAGPAGFSFYAGPACAGVPVPSVAIAAGSSAATFSFRGTAAGSVVVTAVGAGVATPASQGEIISPAPPDRLVFTTGAQSVPAGACSAEARVEARDAYGNATTAAADLPVSLVGAPAVGLTFHGAAGCGGGSVASIALLAGTSGASFWFRGTSAGAVTVTAAAAGVPGAADQVETIAPGATASLAWDPIPSPQAAGIRFPVTVRAVDAHGNATPAFVGAAALSATAPPSLACLSGCSTGLDTIPFAAGVWSGEVALASGGNGVRLTAASGGLTGTSDPFDVVSVAYRVGSFVKTTAAAPASQTVAHGLGTLPRALILWTAGQTVETPQSDHTYAHGISDGTASLSFAAASDGGVSPSNASRRVAAKALTMVGWGETVLAEADVTGWTASTFTLGWTANDARPVVVHYLVIGGDTVQAKVASWQMPTTAGIQTVSGIGFRPDLVLHLHAATSLTGAPPSMATRAAVGIGAMNGAGEQWAILAGSDDASSPAEARRIQRTDAALVSISIQGGIDAVGSFGSMDADGFTVSFSTARGAGQVASLALKGVESRLGSFAKATAPGSQSVSGGTFRPSALVLASDDALASAQMEFHARFAFGAFDGATAASAAIVDQSGALTADVRGVDRTAKAFSTVAAGGSIEDEADVTSLDPAGFTLGWTASDAVASQVLYVALAPPPPATAPLAAAPLAAAMLAAAAPVAAGPLAAFAWDPVPSPQRPGREFPATVRAIDASGRVVASFGGTAALGALPAGLGLECTERCSGAATTGAFDAGIWSGRLRVASEAAGVVLTAASGAAAGASVPLDVLGGEPAAAAAVGGRGTP